jgi:tetratricopeptide (TPR) repeat protein
LLLALALASACGAPQRYLADPGRYDRVPEGWLEPLARARLAFERGERHAAFVGVAPLALQKGEVLPVRLFLQELELALLASEGRCGDLVAAHSAEAREVLAQRYLTDAEVQPTAEAYVLASRLAGDGERGLALLDVADTIDPRCVWVSYARAWWRFQMRRFREAREDLRRALRRDGGHLPSIRLQASMLAGAGDVEEAVRALRVWLERTRESPLVAPAERADAMLDLAALHILEGESGEALDLIEDLDPRAVRDAARAEAVLAAAYESRGEFTLALEAVQRASLRDPAGILPLVQQAMLHQRLGDARRERAAWREVLERAESEDTPASGSEGAAVDFETALFRLQARARLERLPAGPDELPSP